MRPLTGACLTLEPLTAAHAEALFPVLSDPAIYAFENRPPPSVLWLRTRYARLEARRSPDGREHWLNWALRRADGALIGYVQATVQEDGEALVAYELNSAWWGRGLASEAVALMLDELSGRYAVHTFAAVLKRANQRSLRLLQRLGFVPVAPGVCRQRGLGADELLLRRAAAGQARQPGDEV